MAVPSLCNMKRIPLTGIASMDLSSQNFRTAPFLLLSFHLVASFVLVIDIHINFDPSIRKSYKQPTFSGHPDIDNRILPASQTNSHVSHSKPINLEETQASYLTH
jgi:hypothetical protein